jgi:regulator of protease activity HflC (stomatin/prohibitin superfamily)
MDFFTVLIVLILLIVIFYIASKSMVVIEPYEQGLQVRLGQYVGRMNPGLRIIIPFLTDVTKLDLRTTVMEIPKQEVITKDNSPTNVDAIVYIRVIDPEKAYFEVANYRMATIALAQTTLRGVIGDMELDEVLYNRERINTKLRDILDHETDQWGVKVERVEIKEVDPVEAVKNAMTEQTAAERARRAAILRADGEKRSAILKAEGLRQSMILEAEGERQSKVLRAEGERLSQILQMQGQAQALRILSVGAAPLDKKAITVLSLDALKTMSNGQSTKIIFPFEISQLIRQGAKFLGAADETPEETAARPILDDSILGEIPKREEVDAILKEIQDAVPKVSVDELRDTSKRQVVVDADADIAADIPVKNV